MILRMFPGERRTMFRWLSLCLLALLLAGCGSTPRRDAPPESARMAEALYRDGELARAADAFLAAGERFLPGIGSDIADPSAMAAFDGSLRMARLTTRFCSSASISCSCCFRPPTRGRSI